jgi:hypothetical protein
LIHVHTHTHSMSSDSPEGYIFYTCTHWYTFYEFRFSGRVYILYMYTLIQILWVPILRKGIYLYMYTLIHILIKIRSLFDYHFSGTQTSNIIIFNIHIFVVYISDCSSYKRCRFSNEGCSEDEDCCSTSCERIHSGANKRCTKSEIMSPCYADYQCEDGLQCGRRYKCCAPYWGICDSLEQCCDLEHICTYHKGFTYKMCLYPSSAAVSSIFDKKLNLILILFLIKCVSLVCCWWLENIT